MKFEIKNKSKDKLYFVITTKDKILYTEEIKENPIHEEEINIEITDITTDIEEII